ncbi:hypothetical protein AX16_003010 [Volvariella volvacea WC 439]|nr:hypothetical protein AX16_003010 [Volvariella volvacea WC 439]
MGASLSRPANNFTQSVPITNDRYQVNINNPQPKENQTDGHPAPATLNSQDILHSANVMINGGTLYAMAGTENVVYNISGPQDHTGIHPSYPFTRGYVLISLSARDKLRRLVVDDATHTGNIRADPLECDPNTRQLIIRTIISRMENPTPGKIVLWIRGPAGIGKSAIAKSVADNLDGTGSTAIVAGSFFFFRSDTRRNSLLRFIPTLAYQLAVSIKGVGERIDEVINNDPQVLVADLKTQWQKLIIAPINTVPNIAPAAIIIDGLDECVEQRDQRTLLDFIAMCGPRFPISFVVCSRPEPHLINLFDTDNLSKLCGLPIDLSLHKDNAEMRAFVEARFSVIYSRHRDILQYYAVDGIWPPVEVVRLITDRADGQFLYPTTLFKYIDDDASMDSNPQKRLEACLKQAPWALSPLDALYRQVIELSHLPDDEHMHDLLYLCCLLPSDIKDMHDRSRMNILVGGPDPPPDLRPSLALISILVSLCKADCRVKLRKLHSVLSIPENDHDAVSVHHKSFCDFLLDTQRSGPYCIDRKSRAQIIMERCANLIEAPGTNLELRAIPGRMRDPSWEESHETALSIIYLWLNLALFLAGENSPHHSASALEHLSPSCMWIAAWMRNYYACLWRGCRNCIIRTKLKRSATVFLHGGECPISWNGLIALASAYIVRTEILKLMFLDAEVLEADDFVLITLILFHRVELVQMLSTNDLQYLSLWSRAWAEYPKEDLERSWMIGYPTISSYAVRNWTIDLIVKCIRTLPEEHRYFDLNKKNMFAWLKSISHPDAQDLINYYEGLGEMADDDVVAMPGGYIFDQA